MRANLLEVNARLEAEPWLLTAKPATAGFLAVVNMQLKRVLEVTGGWCGAGVCAGAVGPDARGAACGRVDWGADGVWTRVARGASS